MTDHEVALVLPTDSAVAAGLATAEAQYQSMYGNGGAKQAAGETLVGPLADRTFNAVDQVKALKGRLKALQAEGPQP